MRAEREQAAREEILHPGDTCWRIERADRLALIVDAAPYFAALREAVRQARHSVIMIGWQFDTRISLDPRRTDGEIPHRLGQFLSWAVRQNPDLRIYLLEWDTGMVRALGRGTTPLRIADWIGGRRIRLKLDHAHPAGAAHHQKIVVIDDALAFCGGIDTTADRWDTREHRDDHPLRRRPDHGTALRPLARRDGRAGRGGGARPGRTCPRALEAATGEDLAPPPRVAARWPKDLAPTFEGVDVAISRTAPGYAAATRCTRSRRSTSPSSPRRAAASTSRASTSPRAGSPKPSRPVCANPAAPRSWS
jgi:phospholipase D1/2